MDVAVSSKVHAKRAWAARRGLGRVGPGHLIFVVIDSIYCLAFVSNLQ